MDAESADKLESLGVVQPEEVEHVEGGIFAGCDLCGGEHDTENCPELAMDELEQVLKASTLTRARLTIPFFLNVEEEPDGIIKVIARETIAARTRLGPFEAPRTTQEFENESDLFVLKVFLKDGTSVLLDTSNENQCNWLCLIRAATTEANLIAVQLGTDIFYIAKQQIEPEEELTVWYAPHYARKLGKDPHPNGTTQALIHYKLQNTFNELMMGTSFQEIPPEQLAQVTILEVAADDEVMFTEAPPMLEEETNDPPPPAPPEVLDTKEPEAQLPTHQGVMCEICGADFPSEERLATHAAVHAEARAEEAVCSDAEMKWTLPPEKVVETKWTLPPEELVETKWTLPQEKVAETELTLPPENVADTKWTLPPEKAPPENVAETKWTLPPETVAVMDALIPPRNLDVLHLPGAREYRCTRCDANPMGSMKELALHIQHHIKAEMIKQERRSHGKRRTDKVKGIPGCSVSSLRLKGEEGLLKRPPEEHPDEMKKSITAMLLEELLGERSKEDPVEVEKEEMMEQTGIVEGGKTDVGVGSSERKYELKGEELKAQARAAVQRLRATSKKVTQARAKKTGKTESSVSSSSSGEKASSDTEKDTQKKTETDTHMKTEKDTQTKTEKDTRTKTEKDTQTESRIVRKRRTSQKTSEQDNETAGTSKQNRQMRNRKHVKDNEISVSNYTKEELAKMNPRVNLQQYKLPSGCVSVKVDVGSPRRQDFYYPLQITKRTPNVPKQTIIRTRRQACHEQKLSGTPVRIKQEFIKVEPIVKTPRRRGRKPVEDNSVIVVEDHEEKKPSEKRKRTDDTTAKIPAGKKPKKDEPEATLSEEPCPVSALDSSVVAPTSETCELPEIDTSLEKNMEPVGLLDMPLLTISEEADGTLMETSENTEQDVMNVVPSVQESSEVADFTHKPLSYKCGKCKEAFDSEEELSQHRLTHDDSAKSGISAVEADGLTNPSGLVNPSASAAPPPDEVTPEVAATLAGVDNLNESFQSNEELQEAEETVVQFITDMEASDPATEIEEGEVHLELLLPIKDEGETTESMHSCEECGKCFKSEVYLKRHVKGHKSDLQCPKCLKQFARTESFNKHKCPTEKESSWPCEFCGQRFTEKKYLFRHMATHTGEFVCPKCKREFARKESLLLHQRTCDPEGLKAAGMYPCNLCKKVFVRELSLQNHMALHTEEFKCENCNQCFASKFSSYRHICGRTIKKEEPEDNEIDKPYKCSECLKSFANEDYLKRHMKIHSGQLCCTICKKSYARKEELVKHMLECSAKAQEVTSGVIKCPVCAAELANPEAFRTHYQEHTHPYKCELCQCSFLRKGSYDGHICEPLEGGNFKCKTCSKSFFNKNSLLRHQLVHGKPKHQCAKCKRKFAEEEHLKQHVCPDRSHNLKRTPKQLQNFPKGPEAVICPTCGKSYSTPGNLNKHMLTHEEKTEECTICHKRFHHKAYLNEHLLSHVTERPYKCEHCGKTFKGRNSVRSHVQQFHGSTLVLYECETCGRQFRQKGNLKKHMLKHSDKRTYQCRLCQRNFKYPEQLRRHTLWHDEQHRHQCHLCDRKFVMKFELKQHLDMHKGTVFICEFCNTECTTPTSMRRHLKRRHPHVGRWQENTNEYIKTLMYQSNVNYTFKPITDKDAEEAGFKNVDQLLHQDSEHPLIVAEVSSIDEDGQDQNTQTILIQAGPNQFQGTEAMVSEDVAKALQALQQQGMEHGQTNFTIIDNVATAAGDDGTEGEKGDNLNYYIVPLADGTTVTVTDPSQLAATMAAQQSGEILQEVEDEQREEEDLPLPVASFPQFATIQQNIVSLAHQTAQITDEGIIMEAAQEVDAENQEVVDAEGMTVEHQGVVMESVPAGVAMEMEGSIEGQEGIAMQIVSDGVTMEDAYHHQELESVVIEDSKDMIEHLQQGVVDGEPTYITYAIMPDAGQIATTEIDGQTYITQETVEEEMPISVASEETVAMETVVYI